MSGRSNENRYRRDIDPFAYGLFGNDLAMADIEGRRRPEHSHDHLPDHFDKEPWSDDPPAYRRYQERQLRKKQKR